MHNEVANEQTGRFGLVGLNGPSNNLEYCLEATSASASGIVPNAQLVRS